MGCQSAPQQNEVAQRNAWSEFSLPAEVVNQFFFLGYFFLFCSWGYPLKKTKYETKKWTKNTTCNIIFGPRNHWDRGCWSSWPSWCLAPGSASAVAADQFEKETRRKPKKKKQHNISAKTTAIMIGATFAATQHAMSLLWLYTNISISIFWITLPFQSRQHGDISPLALHSAIGNA